MKPEKPIVYNEFYLDAMTGGETSPPTPVTREQHYLAKLAGLTVDVPQPVTLREKFLAKACEMDVDVPTYTAGLPRIYSWLAKAAGQDVGTPTPVTREELYWDEYTSVHEYELSGIPPLTFPSNGQPLLDYLISGNTVQNGTPTPSNPVDVVGVGELSANLWSFHPDTTTTSGVTLYWDGEKIVFSNICTSSINLTFTYGTLPAGTYTLKSNANHVPVDNNNACIDLYQPSPFFQKKINNNEVVNGTVTFTLTSDLTDVRLRIRLEGGVNYDGFTLAPMLNSGESSLPYEPYGAYKIPISSAGQTNNIYLGEVQTTRRVKKLVLTGEENWEIVNPSPTSRYFGMVIGNMDSVITNMVISTHYTQTSINSSNTDIGINVTNSPSVIKSLLLIRPYNVGSIELSGWLTYLQQQYAAGTPVTVWYVLATPETAVVNEQLMKIGEYADTVSMAQAGVEIPTARGTNTLDVLTDVKPSEVYIKYKS